MLGAITYGKAWAEPELKVTKPEGPARVNVTYWVTYEITWTGAPSEYAVLPAKVDSIDWGAVTTGQATATVRDGVNVVTQKIGIIPNKSGEFTSPKVSFQFLNPEATPPAEKAVPRTDPPDSSASPSLGAEPFTLVVRPAGSQFWNSGGLGAPFILCGVVAFLIIRRVRGRKKLSTVQSHAASSFSVAQTALHRARQFRLDGKFYEFYRELGQLANDAKAGAKSEAAANDFGALAATLKGRAQEVGYRGVRPTDDQLDGDFRDMERALARVKEESQS
jgi:hypothetical protein